MLLKKNRTVVAVSEMRQNDIAERMADVALDAIAKLEKENADLRAKNKEFANITDEYVANGYKLADAVEGVERENIKLRAKLEQVEKMRDYFQADYIEQSKRAGELSKKIGKLEKDYNQAIKDMEMWMNVANKLGSQVAVLCGALEDSIGCDYITPELKDLYDELKEGGIA